MIGGPPSSSESAGMEFTDSVLELELERSLLDFLDFFLDFSGTAAEAEATLEAMAFFGVICLGGSFNGKHS